MYIMHRILFFKQKNSMSSRPTACDFDSNLLKNGAHRGHPRAQIKNRTHIDGHYKYFVYPLQGISKFTLSVPMHVICECSNE
jgi:hypothetical protein